MRRLVFILLATVFPFGGQSLSQTDNAAQASAARILKVHPLPLISVRLQGGPLKHAQDLDAKYLLELEPDRMLAYLRQRAGLEPKAKPYGGWDGGGRQLTGHIAGHYLSAVSLMWVATGDVHFKERADYIVRELKEIQDKQGDGYIGALMDGQGVDGKVRFQDLSKGVIRSGGFDLNGLCSPWYVEHKLFAGLRDDFSFVILAGRIGIQLGDCRVHIRHFESDVIHRAISLRRSRARPENELHVIATLGNH